MPRFLVRELGHVVNVSVMYMGNTVPACDDCNQQKGSGRGWCICVKCVRAWDIYWILCEVGGKVAA